MLHLLFWCVGSSHTARLPLWLEYNYCLLKKNTTVINRVRRGQSVTEGSGKCNDCCFHIRVVMTHSAGVGSPCQMFILVSLLQMQRCFLKAADEQRSCSPEPVVLLYLRGNKSVPRNNDTIFTFNFLICSRVGCVVSGARPKTTASARSVWQRFSM